MLHFLPPHHLHIIIFLFGILIGIFFTLASYLIARLLRDNDIRD